MFQKLLDLIKQAITRITGNENINKKNAFIGQESISCVMRRNIDVWRKMYEDKAEWLGGESDITSLGIPAEICSELARSVILEMESNIIDPQLNSDPDLTEKEPSTRAEYMNKAYHDKLLSDIRHKIEYGMATGGMVIKPYVSGNQIYFDYLAQGEFVPLAFDDDGNITDIAFFDIVIKQNKKYTKIERHIYNQAEHAVTILNKAYVSKNIESDELGEEAALDILPQWESLSPETVIDSIKQQLYGFYRVPKSNNLDHRSPLGVSVFSRATKIIEKADRQFTRLDWEYDAGQMAVDADPTVIDPRYPTGYYQSIPEGKKRVFRGVDVDDMYSVFAPTLRDSAYLDGLNAYLMRIEDLCEVYRGTLSNVQETARTATEVIMLKQRAYSNIRDHQKALEKCLKDVIYAMDVYCDLYNLSSQGEYTVSFSWDDSVVTDKNTQMTEKLALVDADIISKAEVRSWYTGEAIEVAEKKIREINENNQPALAADLFGSVEDDSAIDEE